MHRSIHTCLKLFKCNMHERPHQSQCKKQEGSNTSRLYALKNPWICCLEMPRKERSNIPQLHPIGSTVCWYEVIRRDNRTAAL